MKYRLQSYTCPLRLGKVSPTIWSAAVFSPSYAPIPPIKPCCYGCLLQSATALSTYHCIKYAEKIISEIASAMYPMPPVKNKRPTILQSLKSFFSQWLETGSSAVAMCLPNTVMRYSSTPRPDSWLRLRVEFGLVTLPPILESTNKNQRLVLPVRAIADRRCFALSFPRRARGS